MLFSEDPVERHIGATLVYMGGGSKFCLVQCISIEHDDSVDEINDSKPEDKDATRRTRFLFRLTTFSLKYDKNGDLTTGNSRRVRNYKVPNESTEFLLKNPVAFWM
uniref:Uncharacterized protein n=1 Tax=Arundo donax TaxID=35708 RepID=A0A0A8YIX7_ARUDO